MDADTTGVEPDFALVKFKKLSGGGYFKIINQSVPTALKKLGYNEKEASAALKSLPPDVAVADGIKLALKALSR